MTNLPNFDSMWDYDNPAATEAKFKKILADTKSVQNDAYTASLLTQIARTQGLQGNFAEAMKTLDQSKSLITREMIVPRIRYLLELGRVYNSWGKTSESIPIFTEAYDYAVEHKKDSLAIDAAHMLGIVLPPKQQLEWSLKSLKIVQNTDIPQLKGWLGPLYNNIGWTYHDMGDYDTALGFFLQDVQWRQDVGDSQGLSISRWSVARTYRSLGKIDDALSILNDLKNSAENRGENPSGYVYEEFGECYLVKDQPLEAAPFFVKAYDILSEDQWIKDNEPERLERLKKLGQSN